MDNRSQILACALRLFADRGYDATGVQEIVDAAGITKPTLYHYFGSKHGLLAALLAENFEPHHTALRAAAVYHGDLPKTLAEIASTYFHFARENPSFYRFILALWFAPLHSEAHQAVVGWLLEQHTLIEAVFELAAADHGNMRGRQRTYTATFTGMINTYIGMALNGYCDLNQELIHRAVHQFQHGIYS